MVRVVAQDAGAGGAGVWVVRGRGCGVSGGVGGVAARGAGGAGVVRGHPKDDLASQSPGQGRTETDPVPTRSGAPAGTVHSYDLTWVTTPLASGRARVR